MGPCSEPNYGYPEIKPCFYLKLNKVVTSKLFLNALILFSKQLQGWTPDYYNKDSLPKDMPVELQEAIANHSGSHEVKLSLLKDFV